MEENSSKAKAGGMALVFIAFALVGADFVMLRGESVASGSVSLRLGSTPVVLSISRSGEEHLVEISTRKRHNGETEGQAIVYRLVAPDGSIVADDSEFVSHEKRFFEFVPSEAGDYELHVEEKMLVGSGRGTAYVNVTVGDRRVLSRLLRF